MKNLKLIESVSFTNSSLESIRCCSVDFDTTSLFCVNSQSVMQLDPLSFEIKKQCDISEYLEDPSGLIGLPLCIEYIPHDQACIIITSNGETLQWNTFDNVIETIGTIEEGVSGAAWSPDQELITLVTGNSKLLLMSREFNPITEVHLFTDEFGEAENVNVGWGHKSTQFHGSAGKKAATEIKQEADEIFEWDDKNTRISWRADGAYFAVSCVDSNNKRRLKIYSRRCILYSTGEDIPGLEQDISFRPSGSLVASSQHKKNRTYVIFFEQNGLQHGEYILPNGPGGASVVEKLLWDLSSTVLVVQSRQISTNEQRLQFWTCSNYNWMLKYEIEFNKDDLLTCVISDPEVDCRIHIFTCNGSYRRLTFIQEVNSQRTSEHSLGTTIVMNGGNAKVTPYLQAKVPPPMCAYDTTRQSCIIGASFLDNCFALLYADHCLTVSSFYEDEVEEADYESCKARRLASGTCSIPRVFFVSRVLSLTSNVRAVCRKSNSSLIVHSEDKEVLTYSIAEEALKLCGSDCYLPQKCVKIESCSFAGKDYVLGLTERFRLFANNLEIANNCTSFLVQDHFLILTTHSHVLRFIPLSLQVQDIVKDTEVIQERSIERGARLVNINQATVVLQMPRGNVEIIEPRPLLLVHFKSLMNQYKYLEAFILLRKHRINMNLLYDHNASEFKSHLLEFIEKIESVVYLNLFLTSLKNEDFTQTTFSNIYEKTENKSNTNKVNYLCDLFYNALTKLNKEKYRLSILTSLVCRTDPLIEDALQLLSDLQDNKTIAKTLDHLIFLVPVDKLYDYALGMFNFELTVLVAEKSLKDPKEYIPYLNNLKNLSPLAFQHYSINLDLRRYSKALVNIASCQGEEYFEMSENLIIKHNLYKQALTLFKMNTPQYKFVSKAYGEHLIKHKRYSEAGLVLSRCGEHEGAASAYLEASDWTASMREVARCNHDDATQYDFITKLVDKLVDSHKILDAARVLTDYADNYEEAINILVKGLEWEEALRLIYKHKREDFIETDVMPAIVDAMEHCTQTIERASSEFKDYLVRLKQCRLRKIAHQMEFMQQSGQGDCDLYSETSSIGGGESETGWTVVSEGVHSLASTRTNATSKSSGGTKNRRRNERKKHSLRQGGVHEEQALIDVLSKIIVAMDNLKDEISSLLRVQVLLSSTADAIVLQDLFADMLLLIDKSTSIIWIDKDISNVNNLNNFGPQSTANDIASRLQATSLSETNNNGKDNIPEKPRLRELKWRMSILEPQRK